MSRHSYKFIATILLVALFLRLVLFLRIPLFNGSDEFKHLRTIWFYQAYQRLSDEGELFNFKDGHSTLLTPGTHYYDSEYAHRIYRFVPPLYHTMLIPFYLIISKFTDNIYLKDQFLRLTSIFLGVGFVALVIKLCQISNLNRKRQYLAGTVAAMLPLHTFLSATLNWDVAVAFFSLLAVYVYFLAITKKKKHLIFIAGIILGLSYLVKPNTIFLIAGMMIYALINRPVLKSTLFVLLLALVTVSPYFLRNLLFLGQLQPDTQAPLYLTTPGTTLAKIKGVIVLYQKHLSLVYPKNYLQLPFVFNLTRQLVLSSSIISIALLSLKSIISNKKHQLILLSICCLISYLLLFSFNQYPYAHQVSLVVDRSARSFAPLFFVVPIIYSFLAGNNDHCKKLALLSLPWIILAIQTVFF